MPALRAHFRLLTTMLFLSFSLSSPSFAVTIEHIAGSTEITFVPKRVVVLGHGSLDVLDFLGIEPIGSLHSLLPDYLEKYRDTTVNSGSFHEPNLEALFTLKPDLIIVENRMIDSYKEINEIAPAVMFYTEGAQFWNNTKKNWRMIGKIFDRESEIENKIAEVSSRIETTKNKVQSNQLDALMIMNNGNKIALYNKGSRFSVLFDEFGFSDASEKEAPPAKGPHGNLISFEYILKANPQTMFVLDRERAIGMAQGKAKAHFDNDLVNQTHAAKNKKIIFIDPNAWYLTAGGITATDIIISDINKAL